MLMTYFEVVSIPQAVSTVATRKLCDKERSITSCFNTASGKHCCNYIRNILFYSFIIVSIPQAVSTVATYASFSCLHCILPVSIPQAVSTVATIVQQYAGTQIADDGVSIPQAVSTVATMPFKAYYGDDSEEFQYRKR